MTPVIDFGLTAYDYARERAGFPPALFDRLKNFEIGLEGQEILDLGTGTGSLGRGFAHEGCEVTGLDISEQLIAEASRIDRESGLAASYIVASAEAPPLPDESFDVVGAGQCWHWFDRDKAASHAYRLLRPGGKLLIAHFDWLPLPGNVVEATEQLILGHNPAWTMGGGNGFYPDWARDAAVSGFSRIETFTFDLAVPYTHSSWRGRIRASAGVAASLDSKAVAAFDREHADLLARLFPEDPLSVPHRVFALVAQKPNSHTRP